MYTTFNHPYSLSLNTAAHFHFNKLFSCIAIFFCIAIFHHFSNVSLAGFSTGINSAVMEVDNMADAVLKDVPM